MAEVLWVIFELVIGFTRPESEVTISKRLVVGIVCTVFVVVGILIYLNNPHTSASNIY
ncbi:hypothetical protein [Pedobacter caeni]|uniref:Uncharacterized protein n=1 Tax=Pedobacter caeni TaxID=288992 RepID=A0A1M4WZ17_9SPHI|nr:hypothetical protein [Pedobacter caeni]SHE86498.1 hypothetical protein SAMN04488522_1011440 [Pedobacter caeni]